jgi:hypothetical protein
MNAKVMRSAAKWLASGLGFAAASYVTYAGVAWLRYGKLSRRRARNDDALLHQIIPKYEAGETHSIVVNAPADVVLATAAEMDMESCPLVRAIFKGREWILRSEPDRTVRPRGLVALTKSLGWRVLAERRDREIVLGCATKPWEPNPVFHGLSSAEFAQFDEPDYVKIAWNLRVHPIGNDRCLFRTETRAIATDSTARRKFRRYWAFLSPGILLIRAAMLPAVKWQAEHRQPALAA